MESAVAVRGVQEKPSGEHPRITSTAREEEEATKGEGALYKLFDTQAR